MMKAAVVKLIIHILEEALEQAIRAADQAHETATHSDNKAENKYDTLGLEAAYLAHGQSQRVEDCEKELAAFKKLPLNTKTVDIQIASIAVLIDENDIESLVFLGPGAAGLKVIVEKDEHKGKEVIVITTASPLGQALLGKSLNDEIELKIGEKLKIYEVVGLY